MELTPQLLTDEVDFRVAFRGYDQDEVDDFLERVAEAVGQLLDQLNQAVERARSAEARLQKVQLDAATSKPVSAPVEEVAPSAPEPQAVSAVDTARAEAAQAEADDLNDELRRTLVIAQRTADAVIAEARESAEQLTEEARVRADRTVGEANERAERVVADAEAEAQRRRDEASGRLAAEISELERVREAIRSDVGILERHLGEQRTRVRETVQVLRRIVEDPRSFEPAAIPPLSGIDGPGVVVGEPSSTPPVPAPVETDDESPDEAPVADLVDEPVADADTDVEADGSSADDSDDAPAARDEREAVSDSADAAVDAAPSSEAVVEGDHAPVDEPADAVEVDARAEATAAPRIPSVPPSAPRASAEPQQLDLRSVSSAPAQQGGPAPASEPSARHDLRSLFGPDNGPAGAPAGGSWRNEGVRLDQGPHTQPVAATRVEEGPDDAFLAELRKAMTEEEPLGPRDGIDAVPFAAPQPQPRTTRFGRRR